jgi:hypothetical protein
MNILVVYSNHAYPIRATIEDHLYSFRRYLNHRCHYLNLAVGTVPSYILRAHFDLVVYHTTFLSSRWSPALFAEQREKAAPLKRLGGVRAALPQDEFIHTDLLCDFINDFGVDVVFSVAPESEWPKIYPTVDRRRVRFRTVLTGYLDDRTVRRVRRLAGEVAERDIDVGYRSWHAAPWLGRHGLLKVSIVDLFRRAAPEAGLKLDLSTDEKDTFLGDDWYRFLLRCKYTIGVEGGASILDRDGAIKRRTEQYLAARPGASFEEVEAACFPGLDGSFNLVALSPRHLEACLTKTGQVLVEGGYNGALRAGRHYVELKRDFSNIEAVLDAMKDDDLRKRMVETAYRDVVESGQYSYRNFVAFILQESLAGRARERESAGSPLLGLPVFCLMWLTDTYVWFYQSYVSPVRSKLRIRTRAHEVAVRVLPEPVLVWLRRLRRARGV